MVSIITIVVLLILGIISGVFLEGKQKWFPRMSVIWLVIILIILFLATALQIVIPDFSNSVISRSFSVFVTGIIYIFSFCFGQFLGDLYEGRV